MTRSKRGYAQYVWRTLLKAPAKGVFLGATATAALLILIALAAGTRKIPEPPVWKGKPQFNAKNAYEWTRKLAQDYPNRVPWRPERAAAAKFLKGELAALGYRVQTMQFDEVIAGQLVTGLENIYAVLPGRELPNEYVVVLAHYDITDTTVEGAADDASGVGTVLELARVFRQSGPPKRSIVFLLTDSEEFGAFWGAHTFARRFPQAREIVAAVSLDFVAPDEQQDIMVLVDGLQSGYAPLWLRELAMSSIRAVPYKADDTRNFLEFVQRALQIPPADHGAFLAAEIPSINLFGRSTDFAHQMGKIHHTPEDNMSHLRLESFVPYGKSAEILLRSIDALPPLITRDSGPWNPHYWKVSERYYVEGWAVSAMHYLLFAPFLVYVALLLRSFKRRRRAHIVRVMHNEAKGFFLLMGSMVMGYLLLRALPELQIITKYEMFPATQKSLLLYKPEYLALGLVVAVIAAISYLLTRLFASKRDRVIENPTDLRIRHTLLGVILGLIVMLAFAKNSYLGVLLVLPPAYLWMFMKSTRSFDSRLLNGLLFLGGLVSFIALCIVMTSVFHIGVIYWYLFLATSYGLISVYAAILSLAIITVGIRLLRNQVL